MKLSCLWALVGLLGMATPSVAAEWRIVSVDGVPALGEPTIIFSADGSISGSTGCNRFNTTGSVANDVLTIEGPVATTRMACLGDALNGQEAAILSILEGQISVSIDLFSNQVTLSDEKTVLVATALGT